MRQVGRLAVAAPVVLCALWMFFPCVNGYRPRVAEAACRSRIARHEPLDILRMTSTNLRGWDLSGQWLVNMDLRDADLSGADLSYAGLASCDLRGARLAGVDLFGAEYDRVTRWPAGFSPQRHDARLVALVDHRDPDAGRPDLVERDLTSIIDGARVDWSGATLTNVAFVGNLCRTRLRRAVLKDCDFGKAQLGGVDLMGATYDRKTHWPRGFDPDAHGARRAAW